MSGGKGFGRFNAFTTVAGTLPTGNTVTLGRSVATNSVFQYHVQRYIWPEVEVNTLAFHGSAKDGKVQSFVSPGLMVGRYAMHPGNPAARSGLAAGVGFQVATTSYHLYNHALVVTGRYIF